MSGQEEFAFTDQPSGGERRAADGNVSARDAVAGIDRTFPTWLGLVTSHRRLFDASQDGWLRPPADSCFLLGRESFVSEELSAGRNAIPIRLSFDIDKLPFPDARKDLERAAAGREDGRRLSGRSLARTGPPLRSHNRRSPLRRTEGTSPRDGETILQPLLAGCGGRGDRLRAGTSTGGRSGDPGNPAAGIARGPERHPGGDGDGGLGGAPCGAVDRGLAPDPRAERGPGRGRNRTARCAMVASSLAGWRPFGTCWRRFGRSRAAVAGGIVLHGMAKRRGRIPRRTRRPYSAGGAPRRHEPLAGADSTDRRGE